MNAWSPKPPDGHPVMVTSTTCTDFASCQPPDGCRRVKASCWPSGHACARLPTHQYFILHLLEARWESGAAAVAAMDLRSYYDHITTHGRVYHSSGCDSRCGRTIDVSHMRDCEGVKRSSVQGLLPLLLRRGDNPDWDRYLAAVYGRTTLRYPIDLAHFHFFYQHPSLPLRGVVQPALLDITCHAIPGHAWHGWEEWRRRRRLGFFVQHFDPRLPPASQPEPLRSGFANGTWVEVMRVRAAHPDEQHGTWFWLATGSGIWLHLGRTVVVDWACERSETSTLVRALRDAGSYDTVQIPVSAYFLPQAITTSRYEIVDFRARGGYAHESAMSVCPPRAADLRAGWAHSLRCACVPQGSDAINCDGRSPAYGG